MSRERSCSIELELYRSPAVQYLAASDSKPSSGPLLNIKVFDMSNLHCTHSFRLHLWVHTHQWWPHSTNQQTVISYACYAEQTPGTLCGLQVFIFSLKKLLVETSQIALALFSMAIAKMAGVASVGRLTSSYPGRPPKTL
jgi:hypothetical protein